jgi:hypothetical protein
MGEIGSIWFGHCSKLRSRNGNLKMCGGLPLCEVDQNKPGTGDDSTVQARRDKAGLPPEHIRTPIPVRNGVLLATSGHFEWIDHGDTHEFRIPLSSSGASPSFPAMRPLRRSQTRWKTISRALARRAWLPRKRHKQAGSNDRQLIPKCSPLPQRLFARARRLSKKAFRSVDRANFSQCRNARLPYVFIMEPARICRGNKLTVAGCALCHEKRVAKCRK